MVIYHRQNQCRGYEDRKEKRLRAFTAGRPLDCQLGIRTNAMSLVDSEVPRTPLPPLPKLSPLR
jgi:hypothetical protein